MPIGSSFDWLIKVDELLWMAGARNSRNWNISARTRARLAHSQNYHYPIHKHPLPKFQMHQLLQILSLQGASRIVLAEIKETEKNLYFLLKGK